MTIDPETRARLLELVYDLVPEEEAAELHRRIETDSELARAYAEAQEASQLFAEAARVESSETSWKRPARDPAVPEVSEVPGASRSKPSTKPTSVPASSSSRGLTWSVAASAGVLLLISIGGYFYHRAQLHNIATDHLRLQVTGPAQLHAGVPNRYVVNTASVAGMPVSSKVRFALFTPEKRQLMAHIETTDEQGRLEVTVPAELEIPHGSTLDIQADADGRQEPLRTRLAVEPVHYATQLALDKPLYRPGETIRYRSLTLSRFGLAADRRFPIHFEILDPSGSVVPDSELEGVTDRGVGSGQFDVPSGLAGGEYTLVAKSLDDSVPEERRPFFIRGYRLPRLKKELEFTRDSYAPGGTVVADFSAQRAEGGPAAKAALRVVASVDGDVVHEENVQAGPDGARQIEFNLPDRITRGDGQLVVVIDDGGTRETLAKTIPINLGKVEVAFYPEGGDLVAGLENRVYFTARDPLGDPVHLIARVMNSEGMPVALAETTHEGMGTFRFEPRPGEQYHLTVDEPADVKNEPKLPEVASHRPIVLNTGLSVLDAGAPLEFNVRSNQPNLPLVAAASCRGVPVGQQPFVTQPGSDQVASNEVAIDLDPRAHGVIRLTVFNYGTSPPKPLAERLVYRKPKRRLQVRVTGHSERYSPGEKVDASLLVTDEKGKPVQAALGVTVVDDALLSLADDDTPAMPTHFLLTTEVESPEDLEDADFYLSDEPDAAVALDLLLGTQGWRRFAEKTLDELIEEGRDDEKLARLVALGGEADPPAMFDNLGELQKRYQTEIATYRTHRTRTHNVVTVLSLFGGLGLLLLVSMLALLKLASGVRVWVPTVVAAAVCLLIGVVLISPQDPRARMANAVAYAPFDMAPPEPVPQSSVEEASETVPYHYGGDLTADKLAVPMDAPDAPAENAFFADPMAAMAAPPPKAVMKLERAELKEDVPGFDDLAKEEPLGGRRFKRLADAEAEMPFFDRDVAAGLELRELKDMNGRDWLAEADIPDHYRFSVREYAHQHIPGEPGVRSDFTETLYWHPLLVTDADGQARVQFDLSDSVTTFRVLVDAHADGGRIGTGGGELISRIPFGLEPKLPLEVTAGDRIDLPLAVVNDTRGELPVEIVLEHGELLRVEGPAKRTLELAAEERTREYFPLEVIGQKGDAALTFRGTAGRLADAVQKTLSIVPPGFPKTLAFSGQLDGEQELTVELPEEWVPGSLAVSLNVFPSSLSDLQEGMESILREPCGCFEQASTSNYPNVLTLQYLQEHDVANPAVTRRARDLLEKGYAKLVGYECSEKGYEWFGGDPGHEALTAYGLMEFRDMAEVYDVDPAMLDRTATWLLERRDGKGGFKRNARALDSFGAAPADITDAYVTWALAESGQEEIEKEIEHVGRVAAESDDPYLVALAASSVLAAGRPSEGKKLLDKLTKMQDEDGRLEGTQGSITRSGGHSLAVETTAVAALAWLKVPDYADQAGKAVKWLIENRQGPGGFGSTQATILALKALIEHDKANRRTTNDGTLTVKRDDETLAEESFEAGHDETISVGSLEAKLEPGENRLTIALSGDNQMPYALTVHYRDRKPADNDACAVRLSTRLAEPKVTAGDTVALSVELQNATEMGQPMTVAILGLPAGLEPRPDQLDELKEAGTFDYYETRPREVICYWRSLAPQKKIPFKLDLIAAVPGAYTGPASRAYLYYTAEQKQWNDPLAVEITRD